MVRLGHCNAVYALVHGHRREGLRVDVLTWVHPKRDLPPLTPPPPLDREPTRVVLRHPHNSRPLRHALLPERWFVYTPPCLFCDLISNKPTSRRNTSLNMCWAVSRQSSFPPGQTFENDFHAPTMGRGGDFQRVHPEMTSKDARGFLKKDP